MLNKSIKTDALRAPLIFALGESERNYMEQPEVKEGDWITVKSSETSTGIHGYVFSVGADGELEVGYYQSNSKAIKEDVVWEGSYWKFKYSGPNGSYLRGNQEAIVKRGPHR